MYPPRHPPRDPNRDPRTRSPPTLHPVPRRLPMSDPIRRHSPPIRGRARMLRLVHPTIPRALLAPHGLRLSWQIVRDRRSVGFRCARPRVPSPPASVARALALAEHGTRMAVAICEAIDAGRSPLPGALGACAEHLRLAMLTAPGTPPTLVNAASRGRGCWTFELPAVEVRPPPRDPSHKPHPSTSDLHLLRGGTWTPNPWRP